MSKFLYRRIVRLSPVPSERENFPIFLIDIGNQQTVAPGGAVISEYDIRLQQLWDSGACDLVIRCNQEGDLECVYAEKTKR